MDEVTILSETDEYTIWCADDPDGELTYHLELTNVTLHFFEEEWQQFLNLVSQLTASGR